MTKTKIEMRKIKDLEGFDPEEFCVNPYHWNYDYVDSYDAEELLEEAKKLAEKVDGICIAIIHGKNEDYVIGEPCNKGMSSKFVLFNATALPRYSSEGAEVRAITYNTGRGARTLYWLDQRLRYEKGGLA